MLQLPLNVDLVVLVAEGGISDVMAPVPCYLVDGSAILLGTLEEANR